MIDFQRIEEGGQLVGYRRLSDGATVPIAPGNRDYDALAARIVGGYVPLAADPPPVVYAGESQVDAKVRTTDATATEIFRRTLATTTGYRAKLELLAVDAGNGALRVIEASIVAKRLGGGAVLVGSAVVIANHQDAAASTWAITPSVSGNDFVITVTGAAGRTIDWQLRGRVTRFAPAGLTD